MGNCLSGRRARAGDDESTEHTDDEEVLETAISHTSVVGMFIRDGIVVGTDSRLTGEYNGRAFILRGNPALKLIQHKGFASAVTGWWADGCVRINRHIAERCQEYSRRFPRRRRIDVNAAVPWVVEVIRSLKSERKADCTLFGYNASGEPKIFHININGVATEIESLTMGHGSGGLVAHNIIAAEHSVNLTPKRALALALRALIRATIDDYQTGENARLCFLPREGELHGEIHPMETSVDISVAAAEREIMRQNWINGHYDLDVLESLIFY